MASAKNRRTREELRAIVVQAGREVLLNIEPTLGFAKLNYGAVFAHLQKTSGVRVTHASVHERIWPSQHAFQLEVLRETLEPAPLLDAYAALAGPLTEVVQQADLETIAGRRCACRELVRVGQNAHWDATMNCDTSALRTYQMIRLSIAVTDPSYINPDQRELFELMREARQSSHDEFVVLIEGLCDLLCLRPIPALGPRDQAVSAIVRSASACGVGFMLDETVASDAMLQLPTGPNESLQDWRPVSVGVWSVISNLVEFADDGLDDSERRVGP